VEAEGLAVPEVMKELAITRMDCPTCITTLEKSVMKVPGVKKVQGNYLKKTLRITMDDSTPLTSIEKAIEDVGFQLAYKKYPGPLSRLRCLLCGDNPKSLT
jgi:copper chaperone CopZ